MIREIGLLGAFCIFCAGLSLAGPLTGFGGLSSLTTGHPSEALALPAVAAEAQVTLGADWPAFQALMAEPGTGGVQGVDYYGRTCVQGDCDAGYATLFVDTGTGKIYAAWTDAGRLTFAPENALWPDAANAAYEFWPEN
ncbi:MAG: hypothetical protein WAT09_03425 [Paracoccaceae bacterium]